MQSLTGLIFDIKKFSIHDGPGIRTTVFLKGCPLHCSWCHNPEGTSSNKEILFWENRCINCHECILACEHGALKAVSGRREYQPTSCHFCGACADACPTEATRLVGTDIQVSEIIQEIEKDIVFYDQSTGGATFSGGEPLLQIDFLESLLISCIEHGIHTAVDTSGYVPFENINRVQEFTDLFLYDIKLMDSDKHLQYTGVRNQLILENLSLLSKTGIDIIARIPIIPGVNDDFDNIHQTGEFLAGLGTIKEINILPFHNAAAHKYGRLGSKYLLPNVHPPAEELMLEIEMQLEKYGFIVGIGG